MTELEKALQRDLERLKFGLLYALTHGGNMPPGFIDERTDVGHDDE